MFWWSAAGSNTDKRFFKKILKFYAYSVSRFFHSSFLCRRRRFTKILGYCWIKRAKIKAPSSISRFFLFLDVVHLSLLSIFRHGGVFSICKSQSHEPRNDLKSSIVFIINSSKLKYILHKSFLL